MDAEPEPFGHHVPIKAPPGKIYFMSTYTIPITPKSQCDRKCVIVHCRHKSKCPLKYGVATKWCIFLHLIPPPSPLPPFPLRRVHW